MGTKETDGPQTGGQGRRGSSRSRVRDSSDDDLGIFEDTAESEGDSDDNDEKSDDINNNNNNRNKQPDFKAKPMKSALKRTTTHTEKLSVLTESDFEVSIATKKRVGYVDSEDNFEGGEEEELDTASGLRGKTTTPASYFTDMEYKSDR